MSENDATWEKRFQRERAARKESERLLEEKSKELWLINQDLETKVNERTKSLSKTLLEVRNANNAKSIFLANMSHEIRTPLNAIIGFSQILHNSKTLTKDDIKKAAIIESSAKSLLNIINDILDISKIESGSFDILNKPSNLFEVIKEVVELFSNQAFEKKINLNYEVDENIAKCLQMDAIRIRQVLSNLLSNAIKFTPNMGETNILVKLLESDNENYTIYFEVSDSGIGIPKDKLSAIFDPFIQVDNASNRKYEGTGLGLSICSNIVKAIGSNIEVKSEVGQGTSFSFTLTLKKCDSNIVEEQKNLFENVLIHKNNVVIHGSILIAEDNPTNQELVRYHMDQLGTNYTIVNNGQDAYDSFVKNSYDLIFMDINMPLLDGLESLKMIRKYERENHLERTPIIALTANAVKGDKERFIAKGMDDYISKPLEIDNLTHLLKKYLHFEKKDINQKEYLNPQTIQERLKVSEKIAQMFIEHFRDEIPTHLEELKNAIYSNDFNETKMKAHYIKNSCLNIAYDDAVAILEPLEHSDTDKETKVKLLHQLIKLLS